MKCHILFSEKNKKNISKCRLLKILPRVLSVNGSNYPSLEQISMGPKMFETLKFDSVRVSHE